jgi:tryptophan-rich sensory protein
LWQKPTKQKRDLFFFLFLLLLLLNTLLLFFQLRSGLFRAGTIVDGSVLLGFACFFFLLFK